MSKTVKDVVCGMDISTDTEFKTVEQNKTYYFCSTNCQDKFEKDPHDYMHQHDENEDCLSCRPLESMQYTTTPADINAIYTCPMHPEIQQKGPGACPKCGMALEPMVAQAGEEDTEELDDMTKRFKVSTVLALPVFILAMTADLAPSFLPSWLEMSTVQWIMFALATPVVLWGGWPFFVRGVNSVKTWNLNMFTLIALGVGAAWLYSMVALLFPHIFPPKMQMELSL